VLHHVMREPVQQITWPLGPAAAGRACRNIVLEGPYDMANDI
jgi:hypothetical protein